MTAQSASFDPVSGNIPGSTRSAYCVSLRSATISHGASSSGRSSER
ncbi:hypothetical protein [Sphingopyxis sp.]|nr:hypothetical protein [Sphingopyxis sp.]